LKIHIPRLRHKKLKNLGKNLHWATSSTDKDPNPLENPGGSKNEYFLHEDPFVRRQQIIDRNYRTLQKHIEAIKLKNESEMGFAERVERDYQESLKCPKDRFENG